MKAKVKPETPKHREVMCSCGKFFTTPQELWDHYIAEEEKVIKEVRANIKRKR